MDTKTSVVVSTDCMCGTLRRSNIVVLVQIFTSQFLNLRVSWHDPKLSNQMGWMRISPHRPVLSDTKTDMESSFELNCYLTKYMIRDAAVVAARSTSPWRRPSSLAGAGSSPLRTGTREEGSSGSTSLGCVPSGCSNPATLTCCPGCPAAPRRWHLHGREAASTKRNRGTTREGEREGLGESERERERDQLGESVQYGLKPVSASSRPLSEAPEQCVLKISWQAGL